MTGSLDPAPRDPAPRDPANDRARLDPAFSDPAPRDHARLDPAPHDPANDHVDDCGGDVDHEAVEVPLLLVLQRLFVTLQARTGGEVSEVIALCSFCPCVVTRSSPRPGPTVPE